MEKYPYFGQSIPFCTVEELINENMPIDASKAASILRNHKGCKMRTWDS